jgi:DNA modification methylase
VRPTRYLLAGDARQLPLASASVQCVVTSPPYWGLRDYGLTPSVWGGDEAHAHEWGEEQMKRQSGGTGKTGLSQDGRPDEQRQRQQAKFIADVSFDVSTGAFCPCGAWRGVLGLEPTPELYVQHLVEIFREVRRVLRADGVAFVNLGDSYAGGGPYHGESNLGKNGTNRGSHTGLDRTGITGLKPKDLVGIPWRVAFALQADGWWLRADIIWAKPNPMPESITDRPTKSHEYLFLLTKAARYYYDGEAIKEEGTGRTAGNVDPIKGTANGDPFFRTREGFLAVADKPWISRNRRSVWTIATEPYPEAHFATFPEKLVEPCIVAGTSERGACPMCGAPWARVVEHGQAERMGGNAGVTIAHAEGPMNRGGNGQWDKDHMPKVRPTQTLGWSPTCICPPAEPVACRVLDPFAGSGTTVAVAERLGRVGIGVELKTAYLRLAWARTRQAGLL